MRTRGRGTAHIASNVLAQESQSANRRKTRLQQRVRVLVADDDYDIRETLRIVLEDEGYLVDVAPNGRICLELIHAARLPYVVVLDLMMPLLGGAAVLAVISKDPVLARRHAVLLVTRARTAPKRCLASC